MTPDQVVSALDVLGHLLDAAGMLAKLTTNQVDDQVVASAQALLAKVRPYAAEPWVTDLLNSLLTLFGSKRPGEAVLLLKAALAQHGV